MVLPLATQKCQMLAEADPNWLKMESGKTAAAGEESVIFL